MAQLYLATFDPPTAVDVAEAWANLSTESREGIVVDICLPPAWLDASRLAHDEGTYFVALDALLTEYLHQWQWQEGADANLDGLATLLETSAHALRTILAQQAL